MASSSSIKDAVTRDKLLPILLWCCVPATIFYAISLICMSLSGFTILETLRDPAHLADHSSFLGFLSSISVWLWLSAAAIPLFRATTYSRDSGDTHRWLLLMIGYFSLALAIDDYFMIHDRYIPEGIMYPLYLIFIGYVWMKQRRQILSIDGTAFVLAGSFMVLSLLVDAVQEILPMRYDHSQIFEEGFKFLGGGHLALFLHAPGRPQAGQSARRQARFIVIGCDHRPRPSPADGIFAEPVANIGLILVS